MVDHYRICEKAIDEMESLPRGSLHYQAVEDCLFTLAEDSLTTAKELKLANKYREHYLQGYYENFDPRDVPKKHLLELSHICTRADPTQRKYKEKVRSPLTGIRAMCIACQEGSVALVSECISINCPLWSFRMGSNAFFGRLHDSEAESNDEDLEAQDTESEKPVVAQRETGGRSKKN